MIEDPFWTKWTSRFQKKGWEAWQRSFHLLHGDSVAKVESLEWQRWSSGLSEAERLLAVASYQRRAAYFYRLARQLMDIEMVTAESLDAELERDPMTMSAQ